MHVCVRYMFKSVEVNMQVCVCVVLCAYVCVVVYACVCHVCKCVETPMQVYAYVCACVYMEARGQCQVSFSITPHPGFRGRVSH